MTDHYINPRAGHSLYLQGGYLHLNMAGTCPPPQGLKPTTRWSELKVVKAIGSRNAESLGNNYRLYYTLLQLTFHSGSLKRTDYPKQICLSHTLSFLLNVFTAFKRTHFYILFVVTAAGVVPCDSPKKRPRTSPIVQFIFYFWSFEISRNNLRNQKKL